MLSVTIKYGDEKLVYPNGVSLLEISKDFQKDFKEKIIISRVNGIITELNQKVFNNVTIDFYDRTSSIGNKVEKLKEKDCPILVRVDEVAAIVKLPDGSSTSAE